MKNLVYVVGVFAMLLIRTTQIMAQDNQIFLVQVVGNQIAIFSVQTSNDIALATLINERINTALNELVTAKLQSPSDVIIADNGDRIALVAYDLYNYSDFTLLTYSLETDEVQITSIPGYGNIQWVQDDKGILLSPSAMPPVYDDLANVHDIFLYDIETTIIHQITDTEQSERAVLLIPDTESILFTQDRQDYILEDIYRVELDGSGFSDIAKIGAILSDEELSLCTAKKFTWNRENERLYFVVVCDDRDFLASTSLAGDTRLELELEAFLIADEEAFFSEIRLWQYHIDASRNQIIVVATVDEVFVDRPESVRWIYIYQRSSNMKFEEVFRESTTTDHFVATSDFNENLNQLVVATMNAISGNHSDLRVVDMEQSQRVAFLETEYRVCVTRWLSDNFIVYDQVVNGFCRGVANGTEVWDLDSNTADLIPIEDGLQIVPVH